MNCNGDQFKKCKFKEEDILPSSKELIKEEDGTYSINFKYNSLANVECRPKTVNEIIEKKEVSIYLGNQQGVLASVVSNTSINTLQPLSKKELDEHITVRWFPGDPPATKQYSPTEQLGSCTIKFADARRPRETDETTTNEA